MRSIDLNLDAGESAESLANGTEEALYRLVSSVNIACGGHAGDEQSMCEAIRLARKYDLSVGAHPSYPDRQGFGRKRIEIGHDALVSSLAGQIEALKKIAESEGVRLTHVKPHGALYNVAAGDESAALAIVEAVKKVDATLIVVGLAGSSFLQISRATGLRAEGEAFVDRGYENDGTLRARSNPDALIEDPRKAAERAVALANGERIESVHGKMIAIPARTLCIHGDTPNCLPTAQAVRTALQARGISIASLSRIR